MPCLPWRGTCAGILAILLFLPFLCFAQIDEITLGLSQRKQILSAHPQLKGTANDAIAQDVFRRLLATDTGQIGPALPYEATLLNDLNINAYSTAAGKVYVTSGIAKLLKEDRGVWAAVLGHEIGHTLGQHHYKTYLRAYQLQSQINYYRAREALGDKSATWSLLAIRLAGGLAGQKISRNEEHEADRLGLMMMAEAGYHPDFAVTLHRRMKTHVGDQSKIAAFFSDHPRWETREQNVMKAYQEAQGVFEAHWPDPAQSPGGVPPAIATLGLISATRDRAHKQAVIRVPFTIRNAKNIPITLGIVFTKKKRPVPSLLPEFQLKNGQLGAVQQVVPESWNQPMEVSFEIPAAALGIKQRRLRATVVVMQGDEALDFAESVPVSFPKP